MKSFLVPMLAIACCGRLFEPATALAADPVQAPPVGAALRFNAFYKDWLSGDDPSDVDFDMFALRLDPQWKDFVWSGQYRFYHGYHFVHHAWMGYNLSTNSQIQAGIQQVPFGLLPFASHNYFFQTPYYLGLEDDYDLGVKWEQRAGAWLFSAAYYPRAEPDGHGASVDSARYSYDLVETRNELTDPNHPALTLRRSDVERHQINTRGAYTWTHSEAASTELGLSFQLGQIHNQLAKDNGYHWAAALHLDGNYDRWNVKLEAIHFEHHPNLAPGDDDRFVVMGAYDAPYRVAAKGDLFCAGISYTLPIERGPIRSLTFYNDYSYLLKRESGYADSQQNVVGVLISMPKVFIYVDVASGRNHAWLGSDYSGAFAEGSQDGGWQTRFNINFGVYF